MFEEGEGLGVCGLWVLFVWGVCEGEGEGERGGREAGSRGSSSNRGVIGRRERNWYCGFVCFFIVFWFGGN